MSNCGPPAEVPYSTVVGDGDWALNTYAHFSCMAGRALIGPNIRQCIGYGNEDGWSPLEFRQECYGTHSEVHGVDRVFTQ